MAEILGPDTVVRASSDPLRVAGHATIGGGPDGAGRAWFGDIDIGGRHNLVGQVPVLGIDGDVLAVVAVSEPYS